MAGTPRTPALVKGPPSLQKSDSSSRQTSIGSFFQKKSCPSVKDSSKPSVTSALPRTRSSPRKSNGQALEVNASMTPVASSDAPEGDTCISPSNQKQQDKPVCNLPSPVSMASTINGGGASSKVDVIASNSPSRRAKRPITYAEPDDDDESDVVNRSQGRKKRKITQNSDDDESDAFVAEGHAVDSASEEDFVVPDDSEEEIQKPKRVKKLNGSRLKDLPASRGPHPEEHDSDADIDLALPTVSTAQTWKFDPTEPRAVEMVKREMPERKPAKDANGNLIKAKAHASKPEERYEWLANLQDADRNPPSHPDFDPRSVYIPPKAWGNFSPFETQYWKIKQRFMDTIVFFKKGKFYELYEQDATIGHQLFDLKLTDRVNMRMVGVPEMSLNHWANQFVAAGYKIARVDQQESALGKEMREREGKTQPGSSAKAKVIERKLACVLTGGTLVDGAMLQDDMSTYCVSIKESEVDGLPTFGISYVDAATGQFYITEFVDDLDFTKFETFIAQIRPQELIVEKSCVSGAANRILKNNTSPTMIRNELKSGKEFWSAENTIREIDDKKYFDVEDATGKDSWPQALRDAQHKSLLISSFGALIQYLRMLQIETELLTLRNITWYDPIRKANTLVLDGKTLINMEIFANSLDGGSDGTLFSLLNRCVTPFGKRLFKQWVCHPLLDLAKINARLDAVESLNADTSIRDSFTSQLSKLPDLERMISRIHAGSCKPQDFVRVLDGFEQIDYTMSIIRETPSGDGIIGELIQSMPDMKDVLSEWKQTFDHAKAKEHGLLVPERGVEEDFDQSQDRITEIKKELDEFLRRIRKQLGSNSIVYRDNGKEIYQLEVPVKVKGVPKTWDQMSATQQAKRYYNSELRALIRSLQEAQETHGQIVKDVSARFFAHFDENYMTWLSAVRITAQLDCLVCLAKASAALGSPSCRPEFIAAGPNDRSVMTFHGLRHPCMVDRVADFIPNDIELGGKCQNIGLLTGANAAGKSTILRMTCVAVIMAQIGCFVPAEFAQLTPVDRIMSRLGANDNIFAAQSTFFVELSETKKILSEATPRSLVILDELGRGTSSYDGLAVAEAVLHHISTYIGCLGFFASHYHSLAAEFSGHPEIRNKRMQIDVDENHRRVTFLYKLEDGVAEGSFGMHCASMCGIASTVVERAEQAAKSWEHTSKLQQMIGQRGSTPFIPLGMTSDIANIIRQPSDDGMHESFVDMRVLDVLRKAVDKL